MRGRRISTAEEAARAAKRARRTRRFALALVLATSGCASASDNTRTIYAYAPGIGAGSQPTVIPLEVPAPAGSESRARQPTSGYTYSEQVVTTDAELPQLADVLVDALGTTASGALNGDAIFGRLGAAKGLAQEGERYPSLFTRVVWSCRRPIAGAEVRRLLAARFCKQTSDRYEEIQVSPFTMWRTVDGVKCTECFLKHTARRDRFRLSELTSKLAAAGFVDQGEIGEQVYTLGQPNPQARTFSRTDRDPLVLVSSSGIDPRIKGPAIDPVVLTLFVYLPVRGL